MIVSWNWLAQYVRLDMPVEVLAERLALSGLNHESTEEVGGDLAIDLEVTSNRPDCLGHLGVAREVAVLFDKVLREPDPRPKTSGSPVAELTAVSVEAPPLCPQFTARVVTGCKVGESPWWLRKRLETVGVRPISNVVDATNYVMLESGQPLHAYDLAQLEGRRLNVRTARPGESLRAINGKTYDLGDEMLVIADDRRPVGLAGVMGGLDSEIGPDSTEILIESARFDSSSVRKTARALGLHSPSSFRFERGLDPDRTEWASRRCADLILEIAGGTLHPGVLDVGSPPPERPAITLRLDQIPRILGIAIDGATAARILKALGLDVVESSARSLVARPPSWRNDLEREIDLIEEVGRIHGYEQVPEDRAVPLARSSRGRRERVESEVRGVLTGLGIDEAVTFSLVEERLSRPIEPGEAIAPLKVDHSSRKLENALRQSLTPSLLEARARNEAHGNFDADLFEVANVYRPKPGGGLPDEPTRLAIVSGRDFAGLKGIAEAVLDRLHLVDSLATRPAPASWPFAAGRVAELAIGDLRLGLLGEIDPAARHEFGLKAACSAAEWDLSILVDRTDLIPRHRPLPAYPSVVRDLSLVVEKTLPWAELASSARSAAGPSLEGLSYLDTFSGGDLPADRQSLHFGLRFRRADRTLTGEEVDAAVRSVVSACEARFGATLRA